MAKNWNNKKSRELFNAFLSLKDTYARLGLIIPGYIVGKVIPIVFKFENGNAYLADCPTIVKRRIL